MSTGHRSLRVLRALLLGSLGLQAMERLLAGSEPKIGQKAKG